MPAKNGAYQALPWYVVLRETLFVCYALFLRWREGNYFLNWCPQVKCTRNSTPCVWLDDVESWVAGSGVSPAGSHLGSPPHPPAFLKERNIRKAFALTSNPLPQVTVIAGPRGGKNVSFPFGAEQPWQHCAKPLDEMRPGCSKAALSQVNRHWALSMRPRGTSVVRRQGVTNCLPRASLGRCHPGLLIFHVALDAAGNLGQELVWCPFHTTDTSFLTAPGPDQTSPPPSPVQSNNLTIAAETEPLESPTTRLTHASSSRLRVSVKVQILSQVYCFSLVYFKYSFTLYYVRWHLKWSLSLHLDCC